MASDYQLTTADYIAILRRRSAMIAGIFLGVFALSIIVALAIPPVYESTGTVLVESQQIPTNLVSASITSFADERIEVIRQRVMTRENLMRIFNKYKLFAEEKNTLTVSEKIDKMREAISVSLVNANATTTGRAKSKAQSAIAFTVAYQNRYPQLANKVANELVTLFMDENVKQRTARANETTEFLTQEAERLKVELDKVEGQLAAFKQEHSDSLPQNQQMRMTMMSRAESELAQAERSYSSAQDEIRFLELELSAARSGVSLVSGKPTIGVSDSQDLGRLKAERARLLSLYSEHHPDVRAIDRRIKAAEEAVATADPGGEKKNAGGQEPPAQPVSLDVARVQAKIASARSRMEASAAQIKAQRGKIASLEKEILRSPEVERGLMTLMRDQENAQRKYEEMRNKQMTAKVSENLEEENKAERFILLEPPQVPDKPVKPNRKKLLALGFGLAVASAGGITMVLETINQRVRGAEALTSIIRERVLATIPYITVEAELLRRRKWRKRLAAIALLAAMVVLAIVHFFVMPLDILILKAVVRLG